MQRLLNEIPTFSLDLITFSAREHYRACVGEFPTDLYVTCNNRFIFDYSHPSDAINYFISDPELDSAIEKIKECERIRISRLEMVDRAAKEAKLPLTYWNKSLIKRPNENNSSFAQRVRWIAGNEWFSFNQLAQAWIYDETQLPFSELVPFIERRAKTMEHEKRKEDIQAR